MVTQLQRRQRQGIKRYLQAGFGGGLGQKLYDPRKSGYAIGTDVITRYGYMLQGLKEQADLTGIAAGYRVIKQISHNGVLWRITHNGTDSRVYRVETGAWALKETVTSALCTDCISFEDSSNNEIFAWCFGDDVAFRYTTNDGTGWTASTFAGTSDNPEFFLSQQNNLTGPRVLWVVNPNQLYFASSLINGTTVSTSSEIGDDSDDDYFTSLVQNTLGVVYAGKRHTLYAYANGPSVVVHGPVPDSLNDAGGQSDRRNFENPQMLSNGTIVFTVQGTELLGIGPDGTKFPEMAPKWQAIHNGFHIPILELPINAVKAVGDHLVCALGDGDATTTKSVVGYPGGTQLTQNTYNNVSNLYVGVLDTDGLLTWHGSELTCTDLLRGMEYDDVTGFLYLFSGASESVDLQATRCYFFPTEQDTRLVSSNLQLSGSNAVIESALFGLEDRDAYDTMAPIRFRSVTSGLTSVATLAVAGRFVPESDSTTAYTTWETYGEGQRAATGTSLRGYVLASKMGRIRLTLTPDTASSPDVFGKAHSFELETAPFGAARQSVGAF